MKVDLSGKIAVVTGAGGAIGRSIAEIFSANGATVVVCDINFETAEKTADIINKNGGQAKAFTLDITDRQNCRSVAATLLDTFGGVDILVNNAGVNVGEKDRKPIHLFSEEKWDWICSVDLDGTYNASRAIIPLIIRRKGGSIVNISSIVGLIPLRLQCAFTAAKAGVINLTKAMAIELAPENIRANVICPGSIMMEGTQDLFYKDPNKAEALLSHIPANRPGRPEDIAYAALYLVSDEAAYVTGSVLTVDGGWTCGYARDF